MSGDFLELGTVGRPHGIKGEIGVNWYGDNPPRQGMPIFLCHSGGQPQKYEVLAVRDHNGRLLLTLDGINDRTQAEAFRDAKILLPRKSLPQPGPEEAWLDDLLGCSVKLADGEMLGRLDHVEFPAGQEVWVIREDSKEDILFPARPEFIQDINLASHTVTIKPPAGLVEIYRA